MIKHAAARLASMAALASLAACATPLPDTPTLPAIPTTPVTQVTIMGVSGQPVGLLTLAEGPRGVLIRINTFAGALAPGWHGLHIHEIGDCSAANFSSAGAHAGHGGEALHGLLADDGPEAGDLPNLLVPSAVQGAAVELYSPFVTLATARGRTRLRDDNGSALVIHANPDDQISQPIGGAGDRVACAVIPPAGGN